MIKSIPAFFLGAIAVVLLALSLDSWLYAGHFLHFGRAAHIDFNGNHVPDAWTEFFAGVVMLSISDAFSRGGNHLTSLCVSLMSVALIAMAANMYFGLGWAPQWTVPVHGDPFYMLIAGLLGCSVGYDLAPGSLRRKVKDASSDKAKGK